MEIGREKQLARENSCETVHNGNTETNEQCVDSIDKNIECDKNQNSDMKEELGLARSVSMNVGLGNGDEDNDPCLSMSVDNSKEDSDFSDYSEENTRCQLANQAVRAKLLSSVANPANGIDSKLRVSVFDHRIIPKKFIIPKKGEIRTSVSSVTDTENGNKNQNKKSQELNSENSTMDNKRKMSSLSYTVLKASKRYNQDTNGPKSPTSPNVDPENDVRTTFDILLRNLIGDVNDMKVEPPHMMVSSGYESDYTQNRESENQTSKTGNSVQFNEKAKDIMTRSRENIDHVNYLSENSSNIHTSLQSGHGFSSLPAFPTQQDTGTGTLQRSETGDGPLVKFSKQDSDSQGFSYTQRHNYKLTKVTRSMYEIIHDLQNGEKGPNDGRKRSKKGRRPSQDQSGTDGNSSAREVRSRGRIQSNSKLDNQTDPSIALKRPDSNKSSFSCSVLRCVRRPLCNESQVIQRSLVHSESSNRLVTPSANNTNNKVQNDLRNLLCDTSDVTSSSVDNNEHQGDFNTRSGGNNTQRDFSSTMNGHIDNGFNHTNVSINIEPNTTQGQRRPTLNEQFMNRPKPDDHVYETIPGDEKFYEEWKKMRENPKIPKIRRYTTIPDLPGTFIPKEPPALPERKYLCTNEQQIKDTDNYIFMGDVNSNFPAHVNLNTGRSDSGYASVASDKMLERTAFQCYPYPLPDDGAAHHVGRSDETSDGYCSIDNLSLLRENVTDISYPEIPSRDWRIPNTNSLPRLPHERNNDYFLSPVMNREEYRKLQTFSSVVPRVPDRQQSRDRDFEASLAASAFEEPTKPVFQATYV